MASTVWVPVGCLWGFDRFWHNAIGVDAGAIGRHLAGKVAPFGDHIRRATAAILVVLGLALLVHPTFVTHLVS